MAEKIWGPMTAIIEPPVSEPDASIYAPSGDAWQGTNRDIATKATTLSSDPRTIRQIEHLVGLGPRAILEFVAEAAARLDGQSTIARMLDAYARLNHRQLEVTGGDRIVRPPLRVVRTRGVA